MKLIKEISQDVSAIITESKDGKQDFFIEGVFLQSNLKNRNGRVYPREIMEREVARYTAEMIDKNRALGELGHPDTPTVNYDRVSHKIVSLKLDGDNFIGKAKILGEDFPMANIVRGLLREGIQIGVSSRGTGSLNRKGNVAYVGEDFRLSTAADIVSDPSAPDAFVQGIMEGADWIFDASSNSWRIAEQIREEIVNTNGKDLKQKTILVFEEFLRKI